MPVNLDGAQMTGGIVHVFAESTANLTANSVATGTSRDAGSAPEGYTRFRAFVAAGGFASAANGLSIQQSDDGTTWFETNTVSVPAGALTGAIWTGGTVLESLVAKRFVRAVYTNGAGGTTTNFNFTTALVS